MMAADGFLTRSTSPICRWICGSPNAAVTRFSNPASWMAMSGTIAAPSPAFTHGTMAAIVSISAISALQPVDLPFIEAIVDEAARSEWSAYFSGGRGPAGADHGGLGSRAAVAAGRGERADIGTGSPGAEPANDAGGELHGFGPGVQAVAAAACSGPNAGFGGRRGASTFGQGARGEPPPARQPAGVANKKQRGKVTARAGPDLDTSGIPAPPPPANAMIPARCGQLRTRLE